jgi:hypothetical protein
MPSPASLFLATCFRRFPVADAPSTRTPADPLSEHRTQIAALESAGPGSGSSVAPNRLELALWNTNADAVARRPVAERLALLRQTLKERERAVAARPRRPTVPAAVAVQDGSPVERLDLARAKVAAVNERQAVVAERSRDTEARIAELQREINTAGGSASRGVDAILTGTPEPDEAALRERNDQVAVLQGRVKQSEQDLDVLQQEARRLGHAARDADSELVAAELTCLRALEVEYQERFHAEAARFLEDVVFPFRAVVKAIRERGQPSPFEAVLGGLRIMAHDPNAPQGAINATTVWMNSAFFPFIDALPPELQAANAEPTESVVARLIEDLRGSNPDA